MSAASVRSIAAVLLLSLTASPARAQQPNASPSAFGMAGSYTAVAQGDEAVAWNPAMLSMPGNTFFSLPILATGGYTRG